MIEMEFAPGVKLMLPVPQAISRYELLKKVLRTPQRLRVFASLMRDLPDETTTPKKLPEGIIYKDFVDFDELYQSKTELRSLRVCIPRSPYIKKVYNEVNKIFAGTKISGLTLPEMVILGILATRSLALLNNMYPYAVPEDTLHMVFWYRDSLAKRDKAIYLSDVFADNNLGPSDFIAFKNPPGNRSLPLFEHDHLFVRRREGLVPLLPDFLS